MRYDFIEYKPCKNNLGAFINLNLNTASKKQIVKVKKILEDYGVIFFRNQNLTSGQYIKFAKKFGECAKYPFLKGLDGYPEITIVKKKKNEKIMFGEGWHTDSSYTKRPPRYTMLYSIKLPKKGKGNTQFASQYKSYENLSKSYKNKLEKLRAIFSANGPISRTRNYRTAERGTGLNPKSIFAIHRIIKSNKFNKKKSLYLSPGHVTKIVGMKKKESNLLLKCLFKHQTKKKFIYSFKWSLNSLALWANQAVLHNPVNDFIGSERIMHRITIKY